MGQSAAHVCSCVRVDQRGQMGGGREGVSNGKVCCVCFGFSFLFFFFEKKNLWVGLGVCAITVKDTKAHKSIYPSTNPHTWP